MTEGKITRRTEVPVDSRAKSTSQRSRVHAMHNIWQSVEVGTFTVKHLCSLFPSHCCRGARIGECSFPIDITCGLLVFRGLRVVFLLSSCFVVGIDAYVTVWHQTRAHCQPLWFSGHT